MSYIKGKVYGYGEWTPQQLNDLILLTHQLTQVDAQSTYDWTGYEPDLVRAIDAIALLLKQVETANE